MRYWSRLLASSICLVGVALSQDGIRSHYISGGREVPLVESPTARAFKVVEDRISQFREAVPAGTGALDRLSLLEQKYGIVVVRQSAGIDTVADAFEELARNPVVEMVIPVYQMGDGEALVINEFVVRFNSGTEATAEGFFRRIGATVLRGRSRPALRRYVVTFPMLDIDAALDVINGLNADASVEYALPAFVRLYPPRTGVPTGSVLPPPRLDRRVQGASPGNAACDTLLSSSNFPNDEFFDQQWSLNNTSSDPNLGLYDADIDAPQAWAETDSSPKVDIAIIDLGVDIHPDLEVLPGADLVDDDSNAQPLANNSHGTAAAGIAGALSNNSIGVAGVPRSARIVPVRIGLSECDTCAWQIVAGGEAEGILAAVDLGAEVLSNSWGTSFLEGTDPTNPDLEAAIDYALESNRVVVFAAGNFFVLDPSEAVEYPATLATKKTLIAVSATNQWDEFKTSDYQTLPASKDAEYWWGSNWGEEITLAAPGVGLYTTGNGGGYRCFSGTSAATPLVAGAAALLLAEYPSATPSEIRGWLEAGADYKGEPEKFGAGRLNVYGALMKARALSSTAPQAPTGLEVH